MLRLFDDDLAQRVSETLGNVVSRSVSYLAAPAFAVAMLEHKVLRTIPVGRHVLLIADVRVAPGAAIAGRPLADLERRRAVPGPGHRRARHAALQLVAAARSPPGRGRPGDRARDAGGTVDLPGRQPAGGDLASRHREHIYFDK